MKLVRVTQWVLIAIGLAALGYCAAVWVDARIYQSVAAHRFSVMKPHVSLEPAIPRDGELLGRLRIPSIGVSVMVVQGDGSGELSRAAGHIPGTALPGKSGNVGIAAHRDTFFRPLKSIRPGDAIELSSLNGTWNYRVVSTKVVDPTDVKVLYPTGKDTLTLVTCFPFYYIGHAPKRFIVVARGLRAGSELRP